MDGTSDLRAGGDATATILDRLDSIGRLLARGAAPPEAPDLLSRLAETEAHLNTRIDMLGRIVEQLMADREEADARAAALTGRLVDLEGSLAPALAACSARLDEAVPLLVEASIDRLPGGGAALRAVLREVRDAVASLERRVAGAPPRPPAEAAPPTSDLPAADLPAPDLPTLDLPAASPDLDRAPDAATGEERPDVVPDVQLEAVPDPVEAVPAPVAGPTPVEDERLAAPPAVPGEPEALLLQPDGDGPEAQGEGGEEDRPEGGEAPWAKGVHFRSRSFAEAVRAVCAPDERDERDGAGAPELPEAAMAGQGKDAPAGARPISLDALDGSAPPVAQAPAVGTGSPANGARPGAWEAPPRPAADPHADALRRLLSRSLGT